MFFFNTASIFHRHYASIIHRHYASIIHKHINKNILNWSVWLLGNFTFATPYVWKLPTGEKHGIVIYLFIYFYFLLISASPCSSQQNFPFRSSPYPLVQLFIGHLLLQGKEVISESFFHLPLACVVPHWWDGWVWMHIMCSSLISGLVANTFMDWNGHSPDHLLQGR